MAIFNLEVKPIRRSQGGDARAAAAYRTGTRIGPHDYTRRHGVADRALFLPPQAPAWNRAQLWEEAEKAERRKNSVVAREVLLALPHEMPLEAHRKAVEAFCFLQDAATTEIYTLALHAPQSGHDARNVHAHILMTTRRLSAQGLGQKTRELDDNRLTGPLEIEAMREAWARILEGHGFRLEYRRQSKTADDNQQFNPFPHGKPLRPSAPLSQAGRRPPRRGLALTALGAG